MNVARMAVWLPVALALVGFTVKVWSALHDTGFVFDDAFMFSRYAHNLLHHGFYGWNTADGPVYGCTSILYTLWVTLIQAPGLFSPGQVVVLASASSSLLAVWLFWRIYQHIIPATFPHRDWVGLLLLVAVAGNKLWMYHAVSGMDTMLAIAMNAALVLVILQWETAVHSWKSIFQILFVAWAAFATRPDSGVYITLFPMLYAWLVMRLGWQRLLVLGGGLALMLLLDTVGKYAYFGDPLPLPYYVKSSGFYEGYAGVFMWNPWRFAETFALLIFPWLACVAVGVRRGNWREMLAFGLPLVLTMGYLFGVVQIMGYEGRFFLPGMALVLGLALLLLRAAHQARDWQQPGRFLPGAALLLGVVIGWQYAADRLAEGYEARMLALHAQGSSPVFLEDSLPLHIAKYCEAEAIVITDALPDSLWMAATEHGYLAAMLPDRNIIDMTGLHNKKVAYHGDPVQQLMACTPALISMPHHHYVHMRRTLLGHPRFAETYVYLPNLIFGFAVRRDQPALIQQLQKLDSLSAVERCKHWQHIRGASSGC